LVSSPSFLISQPDNPELIRSHGMNDHECEVLLLKADVPGENSFFIVSLAILRNLINNQGLFPQNLLPTLFPEGIPSYSQLSLNELSSLLGQPLKTKGYHFDDTDVQAHDPNSVTVTPAFQKQYRDSLLDSASQESLSSLPSVSSSLSDPPLGPEYSCIFFESEAFPASLLESIVKKKAVDVVLNVKLFRWIGKEMQKLVAGPAHSVAIDIKLKSVDASAQTLAEPKQVLLTNPDRAQQLELQRRSEDPPANLYIARRH
jgi:hypothetical protein